MSGVVEAQQQARGAAARRERRLRAGHGDRVESVVELVGHVAFLLSTGVDRRHADAFRAATIFARRCVSLVTPAP
jgi:hypothetical protein